MELAARMDSEARRLTWEFWLGDLDRVPVTPAGRAVLAWAVDLIRQTFGENWITDNAVTSQTVPLLRTDWFPLMNPRVVVSVLELAVRLDLARRQSGLAALLDDASRIRPTPNGVLRDFQHLLLELEVAAFASMSGWSCSHERPCPQARSPICGSAAMA